MTYPLDHHDCLFTEDNDADTDADTYDDSDADAAAYGGDEFRAQGATVPPDPYSLD